MNSGSATDGENTEPQIARDLAVLEPNVEPEADRAVAPDSGPRLPPVFPIEGVIAELKACRDWGPGDWHEALYRLAMIVGQLQLRVTYLEQELAEAEGALEILVKRAP